MKIRNTLGLLLRLSMLIAGSANAYAHEAGNGGFAYRQAINLLKASDNHIELGLSVYYEATINAELAAQSLKPIKLDKLKNILRNVKMSFTKNVNGTDSDGYTQPLLFTYGTDANGMDYIEALQPYFVAYMAPNPLLAVQSVDALMLHEASHLFGYKETEADQFASVLGDMIYKASCNPAAPIAGLYCPFPF